MKNNMIITIARQYGSGGCEIGRRLSEKTGYDYYDVEILDKASQNSGLTKETEKERRNKKTDRRLFYSEESVRTTETI